MPRFTRVRLVALFVVITAVSVVSSVRFDRGVKANAKPVDEQGGPQVTATMSAALATPGGDQAPANGLVNPGDTLRYTVTIANGPNGNASNVTFSDLLPTDLTLVGGTLKASPIAAADTYTATGNIPIAPAAGLLANDIDPLTGNNTGLTVTRVQGAAANVGSAVDTTAAGIAAVKGTVNVASNGTFTYEPPPGFIGSDTFTYRVSKADGTFSDGTVSITISGMAWFIDNTSAAANSRGTFSQPFKTIAAFNTLNTGAATNPQPSQTIALRKGTGAGTYNEADGINLRTGQILIGEAVAFNTVFTADANSTAAYTTFAGATTAAPLITTTAGNGVDLASGNTIKGFNVGAVVGGAKIFGSGFGALNVGTVALSGGGKALDLTTGSFVAGSAFSSVATTSSGTQGINLSGISGSASFGSTTVSGSTTQGILIGTTTADINLGNTSVTGGTDGVSFQNNSNAGHLLTFGTLGVSGGSGSAFLHGASGGNVTVTGAASLSSAGDAISVSGPGATNQINFNAATSATRTAAAGNGVNWAGTAGASMTFSSLAVVTSGGTGVNLTGGGTITVANAANSSINGAATQQAPAIVANGVALNAKFTTVNASGGGNAVSLTSVTGTSDLGNGTLSGASGATFNVVGGSASVTYSGSMSQTSNGALISVTNGHTGTLTFQGAGALTAGGLSQGLVFDNANGSYNFNGFTTVNGSVQGLNIQNGSSGTFAFGVNTTIQNPTGIAYREANSTANVTYDGLIVKNNNPNGNAVSINAKTGGTTAFSSNIVAATTSTTAINLTSNTGGTIKFSGSLDLTTTSGIGLNATGGGTVSATQISPVVNTISSTTGTALNVANTTIGASGLTFRSIDKNGGTNNAINLDATGAGPLTIAGNGGTCNLASSTCTGGTLQNISGADAVRLNNTGGLITLTNVLIQDITASTDSSAVNDTHSNVDAIHGTTINGGLTLSSSVIRRISDSGINGSVDGGSIGATVWNGLTITNCIFDNTNRFNVASHGDATNEGAVFMQGIKGTVSVTGTTFQNASSGLFLQTDTSGTLDMTVRGNSFLQLYKEIGTLSIGLFGIDVRQEGSLTSAIRIGDTVSENNAALGNTFTNGGDRAAIRVIANTGATGNLKVSTAKNTFTVTDHSSPGQAPGNQFYNFPQSGVLYRSLGTGNFEGIFAANVLNEVMHADGGLGQLSLISERGADEFIVRNNTFNKPWDAPVELRGDGQNGGQTCAVLFTGNTYVDGIVGDGTTDLGGQSPYEGFYVQARNNGRMDLTMQNEATALGLTDNTSAINTSLHVKTTTAGDIFNLFLQNIQSPRGFRLDAAAGTTFNLFRNGSASGTVQGVLQDNGNRGGGAVDTTNPPTVTVNGTITLTNAAPALPNIAAPRPADGEVLQPNASEFGRYRYSTDRTMTPVRGDDDGYDRCVPTTNSACKGSSVHSMSVPVPFADPAGIFQTSDGMTRPTNAKTTSSLGEMATVENGELRIENGDLLANAEFGVRNAKLEIEAPTELGDTASANVVLTPAGIESGPSAFEIASGIGDRMLSELSPTVYSASAPMMAGETVCVDTNADADCNDGFTLPAGSSFTVTFDATVAPVGTISPNTFSVSNQGTVSFQGGTTLTDDPNVAGLQATVTKVIQPENITKTFNPTSVSFNVPSTLTLTVKNDNPAGTGANATGVTFTDTFPANLVVANPANASTTCTGGVLRDQTDAHALASGDTGLLLKSASLNAVSQCTVTVNVVSSLGGNYPNTTAAPVSVEGTTGLASNTATLRVYTQTSSGVSVSGRVITQDGRGVTNARVTIADSAGVTRTALTGRNGTFNFDDVPTGFTYIVSVSSQRFTFAPQVIAVQDQVAGMSFTAQP